MVTAIVGDVRAAEVIPIVEKYFGRIPKGTPPPPVRTVEPPQTSERIVRIPDPSQPVYAEGYHKPDVTHPDEPVYRALSDVLSNGRTSRLYRRLVRDEQSAVFVGAFPGYPGDKFPNLFIVYAIPAPGHTNEKVRDAIRAELKRVQEQDITPEELAMVKTRAKASLIGSLNSNQGLANQLADFQTTFGDWRELFNAVEKIEKVTQADIRRVAKQAFVDTNRTVGMLETVSSTSRAGGDASR
jgi:predicted Zn-dependent peptidase